MLDLDSVNLIAEFRMATPEEESSAIDLLPFETIEVIAQYLTNKELATCCALSHQIREKFNSDCLWRTRCDRRLAEYLETTPCKVKPYFINPEVTEAGSLSAMSKWRVSCLREEHLWTNWRKGKFAKEMIRSDDKERSYRASFHQFQTNDCVMASFKVNVEFLDVRTFPATHAVPSIFFPVGFIVKRATDNIVYFVNKSAILVYHLDFATKKSFLAHFFFCEDSLKQAVSESDDVVKLIKARPSLCCCPTSVVDTVFVGLTFNELSNKDTLHIWDLEKGLKIKEDVIPSKVNCSILDLQTTATKNVVIVLQQQSGRVLLFYSISTLTFLPFQITIPNLSTYLICKDFVAICAANLLNIYNYLTSEHILKDEPALTPLQVLSSNFVFIHDGIVKMFNPSIREVFSLFSKHNDNFKVLCNKLVQITRSFNPEIWEFDGVKNLTKTNMNLHFDACGFFLNRACTRYIVRYETGYVLHFW